MKYLILLAFVLILGALASAGVFMLRGRRDGPPGSKKMARALAVRVGLSILVFLLILLSYSMGWIQPTGIQGGR
jgi:Protein of unknown function (DUF2909)